MSAQQEEFFIGWQGKAPEKTGKFLRQRIILIAIIALGAAAVLAVLQQTMIKAWFEYGDIKEFHGLLVESPVPMLLTEQPDDQSGESVYLLSNPLKYGYSKTDAQKYHLQPVTIRGTLIYNESGGAMIEAVDTKPREVSPSKAQQLTVKKETPITLSGEIVDSKCWLGVMNPGSMKPHRACAINCIQGGIPPLLLVDRKDMYILVGEDGSPVNDAILDVVALPVTVAGTLLDYGAIKVLKADPSAIQLAQ